ncbi:Peroxisomal membrane protein PEX28 [Nakaseomyces bracarensis]|uniref:Peroxisomal membrane protein PEX28 n=1 Tax=Nakaseomyces bracarensis TaxID=273131 RepID=A0ABR4NNY3_9SACH
MGDSMVRGYVKKKYGKVLDTLLEAEQGLMIPSAEKKESLSQRELVQQLMGVLVATSLEKLRPSEDVLGDAENYSKEMEERELKELKDYLKSTTTSSLKEEASSYFLDIFVDKLVSRLIPLDNLPEREHFSLDDDEGIREDQGKPPFSASVLTVNMKKLSGKMDGIFEFQDSIIRVVTWKTPTVTLTALIIFTLICFNLMNLVLFPLLYVTLGVMVQGYIKRHPIRRSIYLKRRSWGKSLITELFNGGKSHTPWIEDDKKNSSSSRDESSNGGVVDLDGNPIEYQDEKLNNYNLNHGAKVVVTLRDIQNMTTGTVHLMDSIDQFNSGTAAFIDELKSTSVFFSLLVSAVALALASHYVNWSLLIAVSGWVGLLVIHPKIHPYIKRLKMTNTPISEEDINLITTRYNHNIILDEPPEVKYVEVYEIYKRGILPSEWEFYKFSSAIFDPSDSYRKALQPPPGVDNINEIKAPAGWAFDDNSEWVIDKNSEIWGVERGIHLPHEDEFLIDTMFKRRRLIRKVIRYTKPLKRLIASI